ncbi:MAG: ferrous iron transport protein B [Phycisphaerae bacterium]
MSAGADARTAVVALVGNPNTGKTTLFNALTGFRRQVANYPGVTVDVGRGPIRGMRRPAELLDLPGTYSLAAVSPDEMVVCHALCGRHTQRARPDVILAIADASNLRRNLYLVSQLLDIGLPVVIALNMVDVARWRGIEVDAEQLSRRLGVPVIPVVATERKTVTPLLDALDAAIGGPAPTQRVSLPPALAGEAEAVAAAVDHHCYAESLRVLLDRDGLAEQEYVAHGGSTETLASARRRLLDAGIDGPGTEVRERYAWISRMLDGVIQRPAEPPVTWSDRIDRVLTHRLAGLAALLVVLLLTFQAVFSWAGPLMDGIDWTFGQLGELTATIVPAGVVRSLLVDGIIAGVGGVIIFLPQIIILFIVISVLEDCGYLARAAFMVDRIMRLFGLSGRSFIPLLSGFACSVPAIMGTRTIADRRERFVTILLIPLMSCSARLPVYVLLIAALVPRNTALGDWLPALVMLAMYLLGVIVALPAAWMLRRTVFAGPTPGFLMELPAYRLPRLSAIWQRTYLAGRSFVIRAGTIILIVNLIVWALGYFPRSEATRAAVAARASAESWDASQENVELAGAYLRESYLGRLGQGIEPVIAPLGWDWRVGVAALASFPAREVVVATLGTITNLGSEEEADSASLQQALRDMRWEGTNRPVITLPVALSIMVFFSLCAQCSATLVTIGREMRSWRWPVAVFICLTALAYLAAWGTSAGASALGL